MEDDEDLILPDDDPVDDADSDEPDDDGEVVEAGEGADEVAEEPTRQRGRRPSRAEARITALARERDELRERMARLEAQTEERLRQQASPQRQEDPRERAARMALMTPEERTEFRLAEAEQRNARTMQEMQFQHADALDRTTFEMRAAADPIVKKYAAEVEQRLTQLRAQGQNVSRQALLAFIVGEKALAKRGNQNLQAKGQRQIARQQARPVNGKGDVAPQRGRNSTPAQRLEGVPI